MIRDGQEMPNLFTFTLTVILHLPLFVLFLSTASQRTSKTQGFHGAMGTVVNKMLHLNCGAKERKPLLGMTRSRTWWLAPLILVYGLLVSLVKEKEERRQGFQTKLFSLFLGWKGDGLYSVYHGCDLRSPWLTHWIHQTRQRLSPEQESCTCVSLLSLWRNRSLWKYEIAKFIWI